MSMNFKVALRSFWASTAVVSGCQRCLRSIGKCTGRTLAQKCSVSLRTGLTCAQWVLRHFYGRCLFPIDVQAFICQMLFYVYVHFPLCSVAVTKKTHTPTTTVPSCNNAFWNPKKSLLTGLVFWRKNVTLFGVLEQVLEVADLSALTDPISDNSNSWWHMIPVPCLLLVWVFSPVAFYAFPCWWVYLLLKLQAANILFEQSEV